LWADYPHQKQVKQCKRLWKKGNPTLHGLSKRIHNNIIIKSFVTIHHRFRGPENNISNNFN
jgi:hypothetical protein